MTAACCAEPSAAAPPRPAHPAATPPAMRYELTGPDDAPLVVVLGGVSATRHVYATGGDPSLGWWEEIVGPGRAVDTARLRVLSADWLDGGRGPDGRPARAVTTHDQADALAAVLGELGVPRALAIVGASYGGMVALAFAERYPALVERAVVFSAAHESTAMSTGLRALQRQIVELGIRTGEARAGMVIARGVAMTTYRSPQELAERFPVVPTVEDDGRVTFEVERYLTHAGERFADRFSPERFLALSLSADLHRVAPERITVPTVLVAAEDDALVPGEKMAELAARLGGPGRLIRLPTRFGHDAFLVEPTKVGRILTAALFGKVPA